MPIPDLAGVSVLVTGGGGFIGSHLVDALVECGARVRALDNFSTGHRRNLSQVEAIVEVIEGDIRDLDACRKACDGVRFAFHEALAFEAEAAVPGPDVQDAEAPQVGGYARVVENLPDRVPPRGEASGSVRRRPARVHFSWLG